MAGARVQRKPTFLWQAALILLPVVILAEVGRRSLRQDKSLAEHDAAERARVIANSLAPKILDVLTTRNPQQPGVSFQVDRAGRMIFPPANDPVPTPHPLNPAELNPEQTRRWQALRSADPANTDDFVRATVEFIDSNPPEPFAAAAQYELGLLFARQRKDPEAAARFDLVAGKYPEAIGESGLPLRPLAQFKLLGLTATPSISVDAFCSNIIFRPTPLTPYLLESIESRSFRSAEGASAEVQQSTRRWRDLWVEHELSRELFLAAQGQVIARVVSPYLSGINDEMGATNPSLSEDALRRAAAPFTRLFWFNTPEPRSRFPISRVPATADRNWLAAHFETDTNGHWFVCRGESEVGERIKSLVDTAGTVPEYFGLAIEVAGRKVAAPALNLALWHYRTLPSGKGGGAGREKVFSQATADKILASAVGPAGPGQLKVDVYLTSPSTLYQRQSVRVIWFSLVIGLSFMAALVGLVAAWRAFARQQQLSEMKSNFVSSVSHELRAPIASVRLMAESLERGKIQDAPKQNEYFRFIVQECRRLSSLIENVLDFSRIEQGRKQYEFEPTDLAALTRETVRLMEPYAAEKGVQLEVEMPEGGGETSNIERPVEGAAPPERNGKGHFELDVDGRALQQALVNLIDNAIKHSPKGEKVSIGLESRSAVPADASRVVLFVADHGPGIPSEEHEKIFERFYRRGSELRRETQGVGIGLSIVKHIVEAHGGRVVVRSAVGQGSRFVIELPLKP